MIASPSYCALMARYNMWQNASMIGAADALDAVALRQDRGAYFGSILGTFNHLLWGDLTWMARLDGGTAPEVPISGSAGLIDDWAELKGARAQTDKRILGWADRLEPEELIADLDWYSSTANAHVTRPVGLCVVHFFNHQTHHRGQIHAMLTAAGAVTSATDLFVMPDTVGL